MEPDANCAPLRRHGGQREAMVGSTPVHSGCRASLLSSERIVFSNQSGLVTLVFIILAATNFRLILGGCAGQGARARACMRGVGGLGQGQAQDA